MQDVGECARRVPPARSEERTVVDEVVDHGPDGAGPQPFARGGDNQPGLPRPTEPNDLVEPDAYAVAYVLCGTRGSSLLFQLDLGPSVVPGPNRTRII